MTEQGSAQAPRGRLGLTIPKAGRRDREGSRQETQDRTSQQGQFGEALDTFGVVNELAMGTHQFGEALDTFGVVNELAMGTHPLFGAKRDLLDGSAVGINGTHAAGLECDGRG
jgi:hypothetical protein